jgi:Family of unknown function (DUF6455)
MTEASRLARSTREDRVLFRIAAHRPFRRMLAHQGIDPTRGWNGCEEMIFRALRTCSNCVAPETCRSWLAENHPRGTYPPFCPNGATFEACRIILDPHVSPLKPAETDTYARGEPAVAGVLADPIIQQLAASDRAPLLTQAPRHQIGIIAQLDELMGQFL